MALTIVWLYLAIDLLFVGPPDYIIYLTKKQSRKNIWTFSASRRKYTSFKYFSIENLVMCIFKNYYFAGFNTLEKILHIAIAIFQASYMGLNKQGPFKPQFYRYWPSGILNDYEIFTFSPKYKCECMWKIKVSYVILLFSDCLTLE